MLCSKLFNFINHLLDILNSRETIDNYNNDKVFVV